jgi:hypothetical protein
VKAIELASGLAVSREMEDHPLQFRESHMESQAADLLPETMISSMGKQNLSEESGTNA